MTDDRTTQDIVNAAEAATAEPKNRNERRINTMLRLMDRWHVHLTEHPDDAAGDIPVDVLEGEREPDRWLVFTEGGEGHNYCYNGSLAYCQARAEQHITDDISRETPLALYDLDGEPGLNDLPRRRHPEVTVRWSR